MKQLVLVLILNLLWAVLGRAETIDLRIGTILGLTGPVAQMCVEMQRGAQLAAEDLSRDQNLRVTLLAEDSKWQVKDAVAAYRKLHNSNGIRIVQVAGSGITLALKPLTEIDGTLLFSNAAHSEILTKAKYVLRYANRADRDALIFAKAVLGSNPRQVAELAMENDWAAEFDSFFKKELRKAAQLEVFSATHLPEETDFKPALLKLLAAAPDALIVNSFGISAGQIILQARELGFKGSIFANNGFGLSPDAQALVGKRGCTNLIYQGYPLPPPAFQEKYQRRFNEKGGAFALIVYTSFELLGEAALRVGSNPAALVSYIRGLGSFAGAFQEIQIESNGDMVLDTKMYTYPQQPN